MFGLGNRKGHSSGPEVDGNLEKRVAALEEAVQENRALNVRLAEDGANRLEIEGEVIWVNPYRPGTPDNLHPGMGVRFVNLDSESRDRLFELVRRFAYLS